MNKDLYWWEEFTRGNQDENIGRIIKAIDQVEENPSRDKIGLIKDFIEGLDPADYNYEISILKKKYNILANRAERQVSDDFGSFLRSLRKDRKLSLAALGEMTGISPSYINRLELRQRKSPSINIMESLAQALDVPLALLAQAAGIELDNGKTTYINDLIRQGNISLGRYEEALEGQAKESFLDLINFIGNKNLNLDDPSQAESLIQLVRDFQSEVCLSKNRLS